MGPALHEDQISAYIYESADQNTKHKSLFFFLSNIIQNMGEMRYEMGALHLDVNFFCFFFDDAASRGETKSFSHCTIRKT